MDLYNFLQENEPEDLIGMEIDIHGEPHRIVSIAGIGDSMIAFHLKNLKTLEENKVLKIPRAKPGSKEYDKLMQSYKLSTERIPDLIAPTEFLSLSLVNLPHKSKKMKNEKTDNKSTVEKLTRKAMKYIFNEQFAEALPILEKILTINLNDILALHNKGVCLVKLGHDTKALETFDKVLTIEPNDVDSLVNRGIIMFERHNYQEAFECFRKATQIDEKNINAWIRLGQVLGTCGSFKEAQMCFWMVLKIDPLNSVAKDFMEKTKLLMEGKDPNK